VAIAKKAFGRKSFSNCSQTVAPTIYTPDSKSYLSIDQYGPQRAGNSFKISFLFLRRGFLGGEWLVLVFYRDPSVGAEDLKVHLSHGFSSEAINAACTVSDIAAQERNNVTVNLFSTPHKCIRCGHPAEVFVGSKKLCATCWTSSVIENRVRQLRGKRKR
jgi:ribosomal protein L37E